MAKKSMILKQQREPKFSSRRYNRCKICGRPHAYLRHLPYLLPRAGLQGPDPRREEGVLVNARSPSNLEIRRKDQGWRLALFPDSFFRFQ